MKAVGEIPNYMMKFEALFAGAGNLKNVQTREDRNLPVEWTVENAPPPHLQVIKEKGPFNRARFDLHIYVERNPKFYIVNVCLFVWFFTQGTGVAFTRCAGTFETPDKKVDCLLTLLLTTVAYKIVLSGWLPVKPYLTTLDWYLLSCFFFQMLVVLYIAFEDFWDEKASSILHEDSLIWKYGYNFGAVWVYALLFLLHVILITMVYSDCNQWILRRESWQEVYQKKQVWPPNTSLKAALKGPGPDPRAGQPELHEMEQSGSEGSEVEEETGGYCKLQCT
eukprot:Skav220640  [mRNA]  locus=scaffold112:526231:527067:- [translate_table: standard]